MSGYDRDKYLGSHHRSSSRPRIEQGHVEHRQSFNEPFHSPLSDSFRHERYHADLPRYLEHQSGRNSTRLERRRRYSDDEGRVVHFRHHSDSLPPHPSFNPSPRPILKNPVTACSNVCCIDYPRCLHSMHEQDQSEYEDSEEEEKEHFNRAAEKAKLKKMRNKTLLYAGLASITTIAASNNIYQSTKASMARREQVERGQISSAQARESKNKALMMDLMAVGVAAVGINNVRKGWKRLEGMMEDNRKAEAKYREKRKEALVEQRVAEALWR